MNETHRAYRLLKVGVSLEAQGYDVPVSALLAERLLAVDGVYVELEQKRLARMMGGADA